jgi:hypothetical protein
MEDWLRQVRRGEVFTIRYNNITYTINGEMVTYVESRLERPF